MSGKALLVLSDGIVFEGKSFGAGGETLGEVVFNTSMTGYQEILTDPSYKGQIVTMTYPQMGNYGVNEEDIESLNGPKVEGFIVREYINFPSNWRTEKCGARSTGRGVSTLVRGLLKGLWDSRHRTYRHPRIDKTSKGPRCPDGYNFDC